MISRTLSAALVSLLAVAACHERPAPARPSKPSVQSAAPPPARESLNAPSRDLGGALPLKHGIFVAVDIPCGDPPNAAIRRYDGLGLSGAHTRDCRINVLEKQGGAYEIDQSCIDAGSGPAPRSSERVTVVVRDNLTFTLKRGQEGETFRYCADSLLPPGLKK
ncbi:hypothetical protein [Caulobacter segnis]|uniref:hypothetical protein n=1 Tax=Caulobacter segnis TaxID=88688 RepID=UPI002858EB5D|nr:hypothetical protein [Caulobacter segnis]MDR6625347.1 hypothetical protein [Caulobacter segnis]